VKGKSSLFWFGIAAYALSFALLAVSGPTPPPLRGYQCAEMATVAWTDFSLASGPGTFADNKFAYVCLMLSGLVNPLFLWIVFKRSPILNRILIALIAASGAFLFLWRTLPREGYYFWVAGMLAVAYSNRPWAAPTKRAPNLSRSTNESQTP
jgi:hypothetical protein